jgi:drug/metabolite transporter (DMT)-like permease
MRPETDTYPLRVLAAALALASSLLWGTADFTGGLLTRRQAVLAVLLVSQASAVALALVVLAGSGAPAPSTTGLAWGLGSGVVGVAALAAFYRGLAIGTMSIVAPVSATGAAVPVLVGVLRGERPAALQVAGIALALVGIVLAARAPGEAPAARPARASLALALAAALGFGTFFVGVQRSAAHGSVAWTLVSVRGGELVLLLIAATALRPALPRSGRDFAALALVGLFDAGANGLYALATTHGLLSVVSVLGSLYPAVTVLLARGVLHERVSRSQELGVLATLAGIVAISAG